MNENAPSVFKESASGPTCNNDNNKENATSVTRASAFLFELRTWIKSLPGSGGQLCRLIRYPAERTGKELLSCGKGRERERNVFERMIRVDCGMQRPGLTERVLITSRQSSASDSENCLNTSKWAARMHAPIVYNNV